jgi:Ca2+-transporting ATPase
MEQLQVAEEGLSQKEAQRRLEEYGPNVLEETKGPSPVTMFLSQFKEPLVIILIFAAIISLVVNFYVNLALETHEPPLDAVVIMIIVIINAILGFTQEYRAEKSIEALQKMAAPQAHVLRDSEPMDIPATEVVPGDILRLETGDRLPADARLIKSHNIYTDEASLTGESMPVKKDAEKILDRNIPLADQSNMVHASTAITSGRGLAVVTETGMSTEIGRIAGFIQEAGEKETPQQKRMRRLSKQLGIAILIICMIVLTVQVSVAWIFSNLDPPLFLDLFVIAVALAVAAIPEGLPAVITITLALGVQRMVKRNAIIRRLPAVETLGSADIICSDKTGTLTKDEMTVREIFVPGISVSVTGAGYSPEGQFMENGQKITPLDNDQLSLVLRIGTLCNNAMVRQHNGGWEVVGDPTEGALVVAAQKAGYTDSLQTEFPRIAELPFDPERKRMSTLHDSPDQETIAFVKGAPEFVLAQSTHLYTGKGIHPLTDAERGEILSNNDKMANKALRVLGMAYRICPEELCDISPEGVEEDLIFVGLVGMMDPPRPEVHDAIKTARRAGIKSVMITGDNQYTAVAVANELGMFEEDDAVLTGEALDALSDEDLTDVSSQVRVYARVSPEHKLRIVQALKHRGHITAMTGDGVNDAPALKYADIGVAMGITGTDVTKEASDMILTDDNYASIVNAIEEGRGIGNNTRKFISYLLSCNAGEILVIFLASITLSILFGWPLPLLAIQILFVNLVTDGLPALALGMDPMEPDVMQRGPRDPKEGIITRNVWILIWIVGITIGFITLWIYSVQMSLLTGMGWSIEDAWLRASTMAFTLLVMAQMVHAFNSRSGHLSLFQVGFTKNRYLIAAVSVSILLQLAIIYFPPLSLVFSTVPLLLFDWMIIIALSLSVFVVVELYKFYLRRRYHQKTEEAPSFSNPEPVKEEKELRQKLSV